MAVHRVEMFDRDGSLRRPESWCIYAAFADAGGSRALVKIGISQTPLRRIYQVNCGNAFPIEVALWAHVGRKGRAMSVERTMHSRLAEYRTRGEWFEFDTSVPKHKEAFHAVAKVAFMRATGRRLEWRKTNMDQVREAMGLDKAA